MENYYLPFAAAYIRGLYMQSPDFELPEVLRRPFEELSESDMQAIYQIGRAAELRLYRYKRTNILPRVQKVLGALKSIYPATLLDIGSGRGAFLWPLLDQFPDLIVTAIDSNPQRAEQLQAVELGGIKQLKGLQLDVTQLPFDDQQFEVVTALEVLEHIPQVEVALREVIRVTARFVLISVPSREDNNPEHIHLLTQARMKLMLNEIGVSQANFDYVHNHMIVVVRVNDE